MQPGQNLRRVSLSLLLFVAVFSLAAGPASALGFGWGGWDDWRDSQFQGFKSGGETPHVPSKSWDDYFPDRDEDSERSIIKKLFSFHHTPEIKPPHHGGSSPEVPEPSAALVMLAGLGVVRWAVRRYTRS